MSGKRKSVRFADNGGVITTEEPDDQELLRMSSKRRLGDATMSSAAHGSRRSHQQERTTYDDIGPGTGFTDDGEFVKTHASGQHTLDSDEEDEAERDKNEQRLDVDNVEGQEDTTIEFDEETKITPFNMKEELEEGFYDAEGNFVFDKKTQEIKDAWLDNIDWSTVKKEAGDLWDETERTDEIEGGDKDEQLSAADDLDQIDLYRKITSFMRPSETITKTLKRLGGKKSAVELRRERWRAKKLIEGDKGEGPDGALEDKTERDFEDNISGCTSASADNSEKLMEPCAPIDPAVVDPVTELTGLLDRLVGSGEYEIYGWTFEKFMFEIERRRKVSSFSEHLPKNAEITNEDDQLDMFAENMDTTKLIDKKEVIFSVNTNGQASTIANDSISYSGDVMWEFRWTNDPSAEVFGPFNSSQMQKWVADNYFKDGVWVRRVDQQDSHFYSSKRIDFDLYT